MPATCQRRSERALAFLLLASCASWAAWREYLRRVGAPSERHFSFRVPFREVWIAPQHAANHHGLMRNFFHLGLQHLHHVGVSIHATRHGDSVKGLGKVGRTQAPQLGFVVGCHGSGGLGGLGFAGGLQVVVQLAKSGEAGVRDVAVSELAEP